MNHRRQLHLVLNLVLGGTHGAAWRWPGADPLAYLSADHYRDVAQLAERGRLTALFLADHQALAADPVVRPSVALEPSVLLTHMAAHTDRIGLIGSISSTFNEPYHIARRFASLDHLSAGRAGINIITSADDASAQNFGLDRIPGHAERYERAQEFVDVLRGLWNSWDGDALLGDQAGGVFADRSRIHALQHVGQHFRVAGPLQVPRTPQHHPLIVQAGGSHSGIALAARHAEMVFTAAPSLDSARQYAEQLDASAREYGRTRSDFRILPGLVTVLGATEEEARQREQTLWELSSVDAGLAWINGLLNTALTRDDLDLPLPEVAIRSSGMTTFALAAKQAALHGSLTLRELIRQRGAGSFNHRVFVGTPGQLADQLVAWHGGGYVDGFNLMPDILGGGLEVIVEELVPLLQRRGVYWSDYPHPHLRSNLQF